MNVATALADHLDGDDTSYPGLAIEGDNRQAQAHDKDSPSSEWKLVNGSGRDAHVLYLHAVSTEVRQPPFQIRRLLSHSR